MFFKIVTDYQFEPFRMEHLVDPKQRYNHGFDRRFTLAIGLFSYTDVFPPFPLNSHERLELFVPVAGQGTFVMGDRKVPFSAGDVLVVDNMRLHGILEFQGPLRRAMVITFLPDFVYSLGSPLCDSQFLAPFYWQPPDRPPLIPANDRIGVSLHDALTRLVHCYFAPGPPIHFQAGCKALLLEVLYLLTAHFGWSEHTHTEYLRQQEQARLLGKLHDFLLANVAEKVSVASAASVVNMSESVFMKHFKRATGETFVSYLTRLRLERAAQLLERTDKSIAEIANSVGFADQSYFDRVFRKHFSRTPSEARKGQFVGSQDGGTLSGGYQSCLGR